MTFVNLLKERYFKSIEQEIYFISFDFYSKTKFMKLTRLLENPFACPQSVLNTFCNIQKLVNAVNILKTVWRWKKAILYNTYDLYMNPIHQADTNSLVLLQNNTKYVFHLRELLRVIHTSLSNCSHFFPEPVDCKNPYTNIPFNKSALYNIYFALRRSSYNIPPLFEAFFHTNFNYNNFATNNEELINSEYLKTYVENNCLDTIFVNVQEMFHTHRFIHKVHKSFPSEKLMTIMKPYLELYFISQYSFNKKKRIISHRVLHKKLHEFINFNSNFGRRKVKIVKNKPFSLINKCEYIFDDRHISFYKIVQEQFMKSHLHISHTNEQSNMVESDSEDEESNSDNETVIITNHRPLDEEEEEENPTYDNQESDEEDSEHSYYQLENEEINQIMTTFSDGLEEEDD